MCESGIEVPFETKGVTKSNLVGMIVGVRRGLAFVEEAGNVFRVELNMDIDLSCLGQCGWGWDSRRNQRRNQGKECGDMHHVILTAWFAF